MKLHPPRLEIDNAEPFKGALFKRAEFGQSLLRLLRNAEEGLVLFINAPWGEGKTTFARMFSALARNEKLDAIYFDAYATDSADDPFIAFSAEILEFSKSQLDDRNGTANRERFKNAAIEVGKRLGGIALKFGVRAATMGAVDLADLGELKGAGLDAGKDAGDVLAKAVEKRIDDYVAEKKSFVAFKQSLSALAEAYREVHGFPLTIIVDELDRCRPNYALNLLERIKHLFDVEGVAFVLLLNQSQMESYVRAIYGDAVDAKGYLLKFATVFVDLPGESADVASARGYGAFCRSLLAHHDFSINDREDALVSSMGILSQHFQLTLREVEKVFTVMALYYAALPKGQFTDPFAVSMLSVLKLKRPDIFKKLAEDKISLSQFFEQTRLDQLPKETSYRISPSWVVDFLTFCLNSTESEANSRQSSMHSWLARYDLPGKKVLPFLCSRISQFSLAVNELE